MQVITFDMNTQFPGKANPADFADRVRTHDFTPYQGAHVQLRGCAPTWAHLVVASQLLPIVHQLDFIIDNGGDGVVVPVTCSACS